MSPIFSILLISCLTNFNVNGVELSAPIELILNAGTWHDFSIDLCRWEAIDEANNRLAINMTAHCFCQYDSDTDTSFNCNVPGPTLIMYAGDTVQTRWWNKLEGLTEVDDSLSNEYRDMSIINIHTHGFHVSPDDDNVFIAVPPGTSQEYIYNIPSDHYPGTHWLHSHHHGSASFLMSAGLFAAILIKDSPSSSLLPARLRNMPSNVIVFHYHWVITADACVPCPGPKNNNGFCSEYCRFPRENRVASNYEYDVESDYNNTELLFTNGQFEPIKTIEINQFELLQIVSVNPRYWTQWEFSDTTNCEWYLIAKDGVYLEMHRDLSAAPYNGQYILAAGGRADIAVKCSAVGTYQLITTEDDVSNSISTWDRAPPDQVLLQIKVEDTGASGGVTALPNSYPDRPKYLKNLINDTLSMDSDQCEVHLDLRFLNNKSYDANYYEFEVNLDKFTEFHIWSPRHIYHQHINHFQVTDDVADGFAAQQGDWHDVMGGIFNMRMYAADYTGKIMIHCHFLQHEDEGMMSYYYIKDQTLDACVPTNTKNLTSPPTTTAAPTTTATPTTAPPTTAAPTESPYCEDDPRYIRSATYILEGVDSYTESSHGPQYAYQQAGTFIGDNTQCGDNVDELDFAYYNDYKDRRSRLIVKLVVCCEDGKDFPVGYSFPDGYTLYTHNYQFNDEEEESWSDTSQFGTKQIIVYSIVGVLLCLCVIGTIYGLRRYLTHAKRKNIETELTTNTSKSGHVRTPSVEIETNQ